MMIGTILEVVVVVDHTLPEVVMILEGLHLIIHQNRMNLILRQQRKWVGIGWFVCGAFLGKLMRGMFQVSFLGYLLLQAVYTSYQTVQIDQLGKVTYNFKHSMTLNKLRSEEHTSELQSQSNLV